MSQFVASGGQSTGVLVSASVLPMNIHSLIRGNHKKLFKSCNFSIQMTLGHHMGDDFDGHISLYFLKTIFFESSYSTLSLKFVLASLGRHWKYDIAQMTDTFSRVHLASQALTYTIFPSCCKS